MTSWIIIIQMLASNPGRLKGPGFEASQMSTPRYACVTAALPGNKLMVVGGYGAPKKCEIVPFV